MTQKLRYTLIRNLLKRARILREQRQHKLAWACIHVAMNAFKDRHSHGA